MADIPFISVVIPVYNDAEGLKRAVPESIRVLDRLGYSFEILIVEDASTDGSLETANGFATEDTRIRVNHSEARRGKGGALSDALADSRGNIFCFYDVDLSTDLKHLAEMISRIRNGDDVVIGSRMIKGSDVVRSDKRELASRGYNTLITILLGSKITDHQCGFKAFKKEKLDAIMPYVKARGWTWDTEVLTLAERCHYTISEIPVVWKQGKKTNIRQKDIILMGWGVLKLACRLRILRRYPKVN